jgi:hypothetical protein
MPCHAPGNRKNVACTEFIDQLEYDKRLRKPPDKLGSEAISNPTGIAYIGIAIADVTGRWFVAV